MRHQFLFFFLILISLSSTAQISIGEWREHLPYKKAKKLIASEETLFCLTESGLFSYSLIDSDIVPFSKTKGLSESEISSIAWSAEMGMLLVGYSNGNLDILSDGEIINISDIKEFTQVENKSIQTIAVDGTIAYLGTEFGIVAVNLEKQEIADTYFIGDGGEKLAVHDIAINTSEIWAATENGVFRASLNAVNLADFNNWDHLQTLPNYLNEANHLILFGDDILVSRDLSETSSEIFRYRNGIWSQFSGDFQKVHSMQNFEDELWVVQSDYIQIFNTTGTESQRIQTNQDEDFRDVLKIGNRLFVADYQKSLLEIEGNSHVVIKPDGPSRQDITELYSVGKQTWAVAGAINASYEGQNVEAELFLFENQEWINFSRENTSELNEKTDLLALSGNQRDESIIYAASWGDGIFVFQNQDVKETWNSLNSPLGEKGIGSMASDQEGNLWILDADSDAPIKVFTNENKWVSLAYASLNNRVDLQKILTLSNGDKWVLKAPGQALFAFNENETLANGDDDVSASFFVRDENNSTISSQVYDMVEDEDGNIWIATASGVAIYTDPGAIFRSGDFFAYRPIITIDGSTQYLLGSEKVMSIATDGANQKWLGTENSGVFLVSENGDEQLAHFNAENSPLPSNTVQKISVNPGTGEVFFVTDKGMISYKGEVTEGEDNYNDLYVYPNPVRETYHGDIVVSGLVANSVVKITDVSGNLVWEGKSSGGQFIWDGKNFNGSRVHTGVYLIFCSNSDGSQSKVIKLLFIH